MQASELKIQCHRVDFSDENFAQSIVQHLVNGQFSVIDSLPEHLESVMHSLLTSGDAFFDNLANINAGDYPQVFVPNGVHGLFQSQRNKNLCCNNGVRFFMSTDTQAHFADQNIPRLSNEEVMKNSAMSYCQHADLLVTKILSEIEKHFDFEPNVLVHSMGTTNVSLTRYYPTTQGRLLQLYEEDLLFLDHKDSQKVILLDEHFDSNLITLVCYRGGSQGVEFLHKNQEGLEHYMSLDIPHDDKLRLLVVPGLFLTKLTDNGIPSFSHRIVTTSVAQIEQIQFPSQQWKMTLGYNKWYRFDTITPLTKQNATHKDFSQILRSSDYIMQSFNALLENRNHHRVREFPVELAKQYPVTVNFPKVYVEQLGEKSLAEIVEERATNRI